MKILIIPTVRELYKDQFEYCVDLRLINFMKETFNNPKIDIYNNKIKNKYDVVVFAGGNNTYNQKKKDKIRNEINKQVYNFALTNKIKMIGICHGAQFLAKKFGFKLKKKGGHVGNHKVIFKINKKKFRKVVNSYHDEVILNKKSSYVDVFGVSKDNCVEAFYIKEKKILGIMWHPERYPSFKKFDQKLMKDFYANNSIISW